MEKNSKRKTEVARKMTARVGGGGRRRLVSMDIQEAASNIHAAESRGAPPSPADFSEERAEQASNRLAVGWAPTQETRSRGGAPSRRARTQSPDRLQCPDAVESGLRARGAKSNASHRTADSPAAEGKKRSQGGARQLKSPEPMAAVSSTKGKPRTSVTSEIHDDTLGLAQQLARATATLQIDLDSTRATLALRNERIRDLESSIQTMKLAMESNLMHERKLFEYEIQSIRRESENAAAELQQKAEEIDKLRDRNETLHSGNRRLALDHKNLVVKHHELLAEVHAYKSLSPADKASNPHFVLAKKCALLENSLQKLLGVVEGASPDECAEKASESGPGKSGHVTDLTAPGDISVLMSKLDDFHESIHDNAGVTHGGTIAGNIHEHSGSSDEWEEIDRCRANEAALRIQRAVRGRLARQTARALILDNMQLALETDNLSSHCAHDSGDGGAQLFLTDSIRLRVEVGSEGGGAEERIHIALKLDDGVEEPDQERANAEEVVIAGSGGGDANESEKKRLSISRMTLEKGLRRNQDDGVDPNKRLSISRIMLEKELERTGAMGEEIVSLGGAGAAAGAGTSGSMLDWNEEGFDSLAAMAKVEAFVLKCLQDRALAETAAQSSQAVAVDEASVDSARREGSASGWSVPASGHALEMAASRERTHAPPGIDRLPSGNSGRSCDPNKRLSISRIMLEKELKRIGEAEVEMAGSRGDVGGEREEKRLSISRIILEKELRRIQDDGVVQSRGVGRDEARLSISRIMLEKELSMIAELESAADERHGGEGDEAREEKRLSISRIILEKELRRMNKVEAEARPDADAAGGSEDVGNLLEKKRPPPLLEVLDEEGAGDEGGLVYGSSSPALGRVALRSPSLESCRSVDSHMSISRIILEAELQTCSRMLESSKVQCTALEKALKVSTPDFLCARG